MKLCDDGHGEIVYDSRPCPLCEALKEVDKLGDEIENLNKVIKNLNEGE